MENAESIFFKLKFIKSIKLCMFTRLFSLLTTDIFIPNYLNVLDRENDKIIKCQILVEIIIIEDNIFHLLWRICVISFISIIYRFQTKWLPRRRSRTRSPLVCIYISLTGKYLINSFNNEILILFSKLFTFSTKKNSKKLIKKF